MRYAHSLVVHSLLRKSDFHPWPLSISSVISSSLGSDIEHLMSAVIPADGGSFCARRAAGPRIWAFLVSHNLSDQIKYGSVNL